ncbi:hypothetical protein DH2020_020040 [Rehmannia glutinosa]|uniref:SANT domain-containing protein n=1 Tax=Rehmannia glutinosa TaxID=99300 RepID=A0ABR0WH43_REHGL
MASIPNGDCIDVRPTECDAFGEPDILPRIGNEYQAELPPIIGESDYTSNSRNYTDTEARAHLQDNFFVGLPIPLTRINSLDSNKEIYFNGEESPNLSVEDKMLKCSSLLVPGLIGESWSDAEKASVLLGLYIFEKNFDEVRRFTETKKTGDILSYYYGGFYGSVEYRRWSKRRKTKGKKCVYGQRIFSGVRQQELLSRLVPKMSEECRSALLEVRVSKKFADEKMSFVDYVSSLKAIVGTNILVEAIGIGTGKHDLTRMALEPSRLTQVIPVRSEIPTGKACSFLTTSEIIKFLSGDYRLSKARSNDLFWEAIWPRLLARGWHSEQPESRGYIGPKHSLVFLMPGVKKFSRRKLLKGDHYFDSVTDVLGKVAKEPELIELENEEANGYKKEEENELTGEKKSNEDGNDLPTKQRQFYLQPRTPNRSTRVAKFTVVDTSLSGGKIRDLRTLPSEISNTLISLDFTEDRNQNNKDVNHDDISSYQDSRTVYPYPKNNKDVSDKTKSRKVSKSIPSRKQKQRNVDYIAPISKRCRRLTANNTHEETSDGVNHSSTSPRSDNRQSCPCSDIHRDLNENLSSVASSGQDKLSSTSENSQTHLSIDLNLPQYSPESSENGLLPTDSNNEQDNQSIKPDNNSLPKPSVNVHFITNPPRHSTRNRHLSIRALEAIADGYLTVNRKQRGKITSSHEDLTSRPSRRARGGVHPNESPSSYTASQIEETENGASNSGNCHIASEVGVFPEANEE